MHSRCAILANEQLLHLLDWGYMFATPQPPPPSFQIVNFFNISYHFLNSEIKWILPFFFIKSGCPRQHFPLINRFFTHICQEIIISQKVKKLIFSKYIYSNYWKNCLQQFLWGIALIFNFAHIMNMRSPFEVGLNPY